MPIISTLERKNNDDGSDMVDVLDYPGYSKTALLETLLLRYLVGNSKPLFGRYGLPEMVMFYNSPYLIDRTLQDFEELVNARILQPNDLKQNGVKGVKKLHIYIFIYVYKTITGSEKDLYLTLLDLRRLPLRH